VADYTFGSSAMRTRRHRLLNHSAMIIGMAVIGAFTHVFDTPCLAMIRFGWERLIVAIVLRVVTK
jgi:hypothetical protein